ncbi:MAG TPA: hypothetical protein VIU94_15130 [Streptomyces sp.]
MRDEARWVRHSKKKVPLQVSRRVASSTDPATWNSYERVKQSPRVGAGIGFVLNGDGIVCIDLDHCISRGRVAGWAQAILDRLPRTYIEVSASGTGLHVFGRGRVDSGRRIRRSDGTAVEVYGNWRFISITENRFEQAPSALADLSEVIAELT